MKVKNSRGVKRDAPMFTEDYWTRLAASGWLFSHRRQLNFRAKSRELTIRKPFPATTYRMPIQGMIEGGKSRSRRSFVRLHLSLEVSGRTISGETTSVLIHNLSASGLLMETPAKLSLGGKLMVGLPEAGDVMATVVWQSDDLFGCRFDEPLSRAALGAAQLRNPPTSDLHLPAAPDVAIAHEELPARLTRLRRERGISRSTLAAHTGISTPSLWAWEVGKTMPRRKGLIALAKALGVSAGELLGEAASPPSTRAKDVARDLQGLGDLLDRSKREIAALAGVEADKVKISIEF